MEKLARLSLDNIPDDDDSTPQSLDNGPATALRDDTQLVSTSGAEYQLAVPRAPQYTAFGSDTTSGNDTSSGSTG